MTQSDKSSIATDQRISDIGPILKKARKDKKLTIEQVHAETHVPVAKLSLIEKSDFDALGDEVFTQGYIRRFAKVVGADADVLVANYQIYSARTAPSSVVDQPEPTHHPANGLSELLNSLPPNLKNNKLLLIGLPALLVFVVVTVLILTFSGESSTPSINDSLVADDSSLLDQQQVPEQGADQEPEQEQGQALYSPLTDDLIESSEPIAEKLAVSGALLLGQSDDQSLATENSGQTLEPLNASSSNVVDTSQNLAQSESVSESDTDTSLLELSFTDSCWIEVKDKNNEVLFADLKNTGDNLRLFGRAPFSVMLGNVNAVSELKFEGQMVAVEPLGNRKTRRLEIGASN